MLAREIAVEQTGREAGLPCDVVDRRPWSPRAAKARAAAVRMAARPCACRRDFPVVSETCRSREHRRLHSAKNRSRVKKTASRPRADRRWLGSGLPYRPAIRYARGRRRGGVAGETDEVPGRRKSKHYFPVSERGRVSFQERRGRAGLRRRHRPAAGRHRGARRRGAARRRSASPRASRCCSTTPTVDRGLPASSRPTGAWWASSPAARSATRCTTTRCSPTTSRSCSGPSPARSRSATTPSTTCATPARASTSSHLHPIDGPMGRAICFVTPDGERSFGISRGIMDELPREAIPRPLDQPAPRPWC